MEDGRVLVCGLQSGRVLREFPHGSPVSGIAWDPSGRRLAVTCADLDIHVYDLDSGNRLSLLKGHSAAPTETSFSHGGNLLASIGMDHTLRLWHPLDGSPLLTVSGVGFRGPPMFAPNDRLLGHQAVGSRIALLEVVAAPECLKILAEPMWSERLWSTDISPDGLLLAGACEDGVRLWNLRSGAQVACLPGRSWRAVHFAPDGSLITSGWSGLWRWPIECYVESDTPFRETLGTGGDAACRQGSPPAHERRIGPSRRIGAVPQGRAEGCSLSRDGRILAVAVDGVATVIDLETNGVMAQFRDYVGLYQTALSRDGRWLACGTWHGAGTKVFDLRDQRPAFSWDATDSTVGFSPDGTWLVTCTGASYQLWSVGDWRPRLSIARDGSSDIPGPVAFAPDGRAMAVVPAWNIVRLIDISTGCELASLEAPDVYERVQTLSFSPDGAALVAGGLCRRLHCWDLGLIRRRLAAMGLDWDSPPLRSGETPPASAPINLKVLPPLAR